MDQSRNINFFNLLGSSAGNPNAIIPIGFTYLGNSSISETLSSRNAPTK
ncbi:MAG TPA: hypothetical protein VJ583_10790 [Nitrososphaeraceae archaeon]|nr:hypothetical protein [Nitrososphaeraceae archaeon]